jgi:hypothetical protein
MHKKSCHHRGGQNKTKSGKKFKKSLFRIDYLNIRGLKGKIQEVNKHLEEKSPSQDQQTFKLIVLAANEIYIKDRYFIVNTDPDSSFIFRKFATLTNPPVLIV